MKPFVAILAAVFGAGALLFIASEPRVVQHEMTPAEIAQIEAEVMAFSDDWAAAFNEMNADRLAAYWVQENVSSVSFADRRVGIEEISAAYPDLFSGRVSTNQEWLPGRVVDVLSPTAALFHGTVRSEITPSEGDAFVQHVHFTHLLRKVDGTWKLQRNHVSGGVVTDR